MNAYLFRHMTRLLCVMSAVLLWCDRAEAASCSISTTSVSFGSYDVFSGTPTDTTGTVSYSCHGNAANINITLSKGTSTTFNPRTLTDGADTLSYNLYLNASRTTIWGDGTQSSSTYTDAAPPNNQNVTVTIYARIPSGQDVGAGSYTDNVTATVNF